MFNLAVGEQIVRRKCRIDDEETVIPAAVKITKVRSGKTCGFRASHLLPGLPSITQIVSRRTTKNLK